MLSNGDTSQLNLSHVTNNWKGKTEKKLKSKKTDTRRNRPIGNDAVRGICGVSPGGEKEGYGGEDLQKRKVLSLEWKSKGVMDDESGESMEPMEEVPLKELGEAELERLVRGWRRETGSWFQRRGEAY